MKEAKNVRFKRRGKRERKQPPKEGELNGKPQEGAKLRSGG
jgi:hypothetical protein